MPGTLTAYVLSFTASVVQALFTPAVALYAYRLGYAEAEVGFLTGVASAVYVAGALSSARLSRLLGEKATVAAALGLLAGSLLLIPRLIGWVQIAAAASAVFLAFGFFWPAVENIVSSKGGSVSRFSFAWSSGSLFGAAATSALLSLTPSLQFTTLAAVAAASAAAGVSLPARAAPCGDPPGDTGRALRAWGPWILCLSYSVSSGGVLTFYPLLVEQRGLPLAHVSLANTSMLLSRTLTFFFFEKLPSPLRHLTGGTLMLLGSLLLLLGGDPLLVMAGAAAAGVGQGVVYANALSEIFAVKEGVSTYTSLFEASIGFGYALGPIAGAAAASATGVAPLAVTSLLAPLLAAAVRLRYGRR
ncbi:MAG: hypothetical protein QW753_05120 [Thermofilum sp.]